MNRRTIVVGIISSIAGASSAKEVAASLPRTGGGAWVRGEHYETIRTTADVEPKPEKAAVMEFFWYGCPHCFAIESQLMNWVKTNEKKIVFSKTPTPFYDEDREHARLYYTLRMLDRDDLHSKVFEEIHQRGNRLYVPRSDSGTRELLVKFATKHRIPREEFLKARDSEFVSSRVTKARDMARRNKITNVPSIVVDGTYLTRVELAGDLSSFFKLLDDLVSMQRGSPANLKPRPSRS